MPDYRKSVSLAAALLIVLLVAPSAEAKFLDQAKLKLLSLSGAEALTFSEDSTESRGRRCVGTTSSRIGFRGTERATVYVFLKRVHGAVRTILAPDPDPKNFDAVPLAGEATLSRTVSYPETAGCEDPPTECPEATVPAKPFVLGTTDPARGVGTGVMDIRWPAAYPESCEFLLSQVSGEPVGPVGLPSPTVFAQAIPRKQLFNERRERLEGTAVVEEQLAESVEPPSADTGTVSGTYTEEIAVELKRLKLRK